MLARFDRVFRMPATLGLAIAAAVTVTLVAPVAAGAATSNAPSASARLAGSAVQPAGRVQATLLAPQPPRKSSGAQSLPLHTMNPAALRAAKLSAAGPSQRPSGNPSRISAAPSVGAVFNGLNSPGLSANDEGNAATPPDSTGAIGPTRYIEMVNQLVGVFDRSNLARLSQLDLGSFTAVPAGLTTSDPQIQWDPQANRWFYGAIGFATGNNYLLFGWSKTADPSDLTAGWCRYGVSTGSNLQDYPKLGHDANFLTVGSNVYDDSKAGFPFVTANIWAISKPAAGDSTCGSGVSAIFFADATHLLKNSDGSLAFTPVPANTADAATNEYIVAAHDVSVTSQSKVMVWHMTPGPVLVPDGDVSVGSSYSVPPSIPQPGVGYLLDSLDGRLTQAVAHFDPIAGAEAVWTQHTVAGSGRSVVRWYEFLPATLAIRQQGQLVSATDFYWNAAISPSSAGSSAAIFYNRGSSSLLAVIGAQTRMSSTPLGQMDAGEVLLGSSSAADQETGFTGNCTPNSCRWGDYSGATPDPINAGVVWGSNQLSGPAFPLGLGFAQWTTQNFAVSVTTGLSYTQSPQGNWVGTYGADGHALLGWNGASDLVSLPKSSLVLDQGARYQWIASTTAVQSLQSPDTSPRRAACLYDGSQLRLHMVFPAAYSGTLHLYALDWDAYGRRETITINDGSGPQTANISSDFSKGVWVNAPISVAAGGTVTISVTRTAGANAVLSGIFLGGASPIPAAPTALTATAVSSSSISLSWTGSSGASSYKIQRSADGSTGWSQVGSSITAAFTDTGLNASTTYFYRVLASNGSGDSAPSNVASASTGAGLTYSQSPQGSWVGTYGADGSALLGWNGSSDLVSLPQSSLVLDQGARYQWSAATTAVQALQSPDASTRRAACIYDASQIHLHLVFPAAYSGTLHLYALDWDAYGRRETITINDGSGPQTANISSDFRQGAWVNAPINVVAGGTVTITVTRTASVNAVLSGIFLG